MLFANVNNEKVEASPKTNGKCPLCEGDVLSKCGEINIWHWAHYKDKSCDSWYEPETEWHKNWKLIFGKENCEIIISKNGGRHIADILTTNKIVIELQNSPIEKSVIRKRESFYGEEMLWVINGKDFKDNFRIAAPTHSETINAELEYYYRHNPLLSETEKANGLKAKDELDFQWSWSRKTWSDAQRSIFIDFGDEDLFWVQSGMGTSSGKGKKIKKEVFLKKYGGNLEKIETLIDNQKNDSTESTIPA